MGKMVLMEQMEKKELKERKELMGK
jgi:hypothetical protein